jgi:hypothetical protein
VNSRCHGQLPGADLPLEGEREGRAGFDPFAGDDVRRVRRIAPQYGSAGGVVVRIGLCRFLRIAAVQFCFSGSARSKVNPMGVAFPVCSDCAKYRAGVLANQDRLRALFRRRVEVGERLETCDRSRRQQNRLPLDPQPVREVSAHEPVIAVVRSRA